LLGWPDGQAREVRGLGVRGLTGIEGVEPGHDVNPC